MPSLLRIENLNVTLGDREGTGRGRILRGVDLRVEEGERLALVGESGCGKSVTALSVLGLLPRPPMELTEGRILYKGRDLAGLQGKDWKGIRGKEIGIVFQEPLTSLNPSRRVGDQILEALRLHVPGSGAERDRAVHRLLQDVGLPDPDRISRQYPHQLSGGMCQRVMLAMALAPGPALLIADEPTTALDVTVQSQILEMLFRMTAQKGMSVLFITHDLRIARHHSDRVAILYAGRVVEEGTPGEIFKNPRHPYTEGLLASLPDMGQKGRDLSTIPGSVPGPADRTAGCAFGPRCPKFRERCAAEEPPWSGSGKGHAARCFYPSGN